MFRSILFISIVIWMISCETDPEEAKKVTESVQEVNIEKGKDVTIFYSDSGRLMTQLKAPVLLNYNNEKEPYSELPDGLKLYFYNSQGEIDNELIADYGIYKREENQMIARNNVVAVNRKGEQLTTEELIWDEKTRKIYSDKFVKITTDDEIIYGEGFEANEDFSNYKIRKIKGTLKVNTDETSHE